MEFVFGYYLDIWDLILEYILFFVISGYLKIKKEIKKYFRLFVCDLFLWIEYTSFFELLIKLKKEEEKIYLFI